MKSYFKILILFVFTIMSYNCNAQLEFLNIRIIPTGEDNYRFMGDTTEMSSIIKYYTVNDTLTINTTIFPYTETRRKEWTRYYGYAKVWWIDYNDYKWINRWQLGYYWKYRIKSDISNVVNISLNKQEIKILQQYLISKEYYLGEYELDGIFGFYTKQACIKEIETNEHTADDIIKWYTKNKSKKIAVKTLFYLRQIY